ncbi:MAG: SIS domain-containing protein, partial [Acidimicrobiales bacterium]
MTSEATDFLYPFIEGDEKDSGSLLVDLAQSAQGKWTESTALRERTLTESHDLLNEIARAMAGRFLAGGRLFTFGNGGSATDAEGVAQLYTRPPGDAARALPARSLVDDQAVITALSNDVGFDNVFSRQLIAHGQPGDIATGFSTSGNSENLMMAFGEAHKRGMLTVGFSGYGGGRMAGDPRVHHCLVARSQSVHRIQEAQA